jgi:hypothetical protein
MDNSIDWSLYMIIALGALGLGIKLINIIGY